MSLSAWWSFLFYGGLVIFAGGMFMTLPGKLTAIRLARWSILASVFLAVAGLVTGTPF